MIPGVHKVSDQIVRNRLWIAGIRVKRHVISVFLNQQHHQNRLMQNNCRLFQHGNARQYTARVTTYYLQNNIIPVLLWAFKSTYFNPMEYIWTELDRRVQERQPTPLSLQQLVVVLQAGCLNIPQQVIWNMTSSMQRRYQAATDAVDIRDIDKWWIWPMRAQWIVVKNENVNFHVSFNVFFFLI
jgi:hypothetical protein